VAGVYDAQYKALSSLPKDTPRPLRLICLTDLIVLISYRYYTYSRYTVKKNLVGLLKNTQNRLFITRGTTSDIPKIVTRAIQGALKRFEGIFIRPEIKTAISTDFKNKAGASVEKAPGFSKRKNLLAYRANWTKTLFTILHVTMSKMGPALGLKKSYYAAGPKL